MNKYLLILLLTLGVFLNTNAQGYSIDFKINGLEDSAAYLGYHFGLKKYVTDTSLVVDGKIHFEDDKELPKGIYFLYSKSYYMEFILVPGEQQVSFQTSKTDIYDDLKIKGSEENQIFADFQIDMGKKGKASKSLRDQLKDSGVTSSDSTQIIDKIVAIEKETKELKQDYIAKYPDSFLAQLLHLMETPEPPEMADIEDAKEKAKAQFYYVRNHYFDHIDLADSGLIRTPVYHNRLQQYVDKFTIQHPDSIFESISFILDQSEPSRELYRYWAVSFTSEYQNPKIMGMDKVFVLLAEEYYLKNRFDWVSEDVIKKVKEEVLYLRPTLLESTAPRFIVKDTLGKSYDLYALDNDFVVLFFYSPTCGHCKKKAPITLEAYHNLTKDGVDVAFWGVTTETEREKWIKFIKDQKADWVNLADLDYRSNFRADYNVRTTPTIVILDKDKKVIAKKLDAEQIEQFIRDQVERQALKDKG